MNEFDDASMEFSETETIEVPETSDWVDFDSAETNDISIDTAENVDVEDIPDLPLEARSMTVIFNPKRRRLRIMLVLMGLTKRLTT